MSRLLALLVTVVALPAVAAPRVQGGVYGGVGPAESLYTNWLAGGWFGVGVTERLSLEASGSYQDGLSQRTDLFEFLLDEALIDPDDALADEIRWTAELLARLEVLQGKLALLQSTLAGPHALHVGLGGGVRALSSASGAEHLAPTALVAVGADLGLTRWLVLRTDLRGYGQVRRDESFGLGAEILLGLGARW